MLGDPTTEGSNQEQELRRTFRRSRFVEEMGRVFFASFLQKRRLSSPIVTGQWPENFI